jgi:DNA (cytosine-5)-methyltransferase 1
MPELTFGSLFAGIGGIDLGFERCGMRCKWQVEINDYATKVLEKHWPEVHRERDIRQCGASNLERVDIIAGGFPCQDISYAGLGAGLDGERSGLFFEAIRLVRELRPRAIVLENVAALLTRGLDRVLGTLAEIGYDAQWHCIPAAAVGAPHIRDRVFVIGFLSDSISAGARNQSREDRGQERESSGTREPEALRQIHREAGSGRIESVCEALAYTSPQLGTRGWDANSDDENSKQARHTKDSQPSGAGSGCHTGKSPDVADTDLQHGQRWAEPQQPSSEGRQARIESCGSGTDVSNAIGERLEKRERQDAIRSRTKEWPESIGGQWWAVEPAVGRVANGIPRRVDRLRGLGNAVVPQVAELVGRMVIDLLNEVEKGDGLE